MERNAQAAPRPESSSQPDAERHYEMLTAPPRTPRLRKSPTRKSA